MADILSSSLAPPRDSRSPHKHILRPRRSFLGKPNVEPANLRSPLKLADGNVVIPPKDASTKGGKGRGGAVLFPASPVKVEEPQETSRGGMAAIREAAGLKKFATSLSGAFSGSRGKAAGITRRAKQGFDLSDWNYDLAAIASDPTTPSSPSGSTASNKPTSTLPTICTTSIPGSDFGRDDLVTPTTATFPSNSSMPLGSAFSAALELPTTTETRRRKSDEMEESDRVDFLSTAPPVRRDPTGRSHSLAHAHTLRSSRTLSHHASLAVESPRHTPAASTSKLQHSQTPSHPSTRDAHNPAFINPFSATFSPAPSRLAEEDSASAPPPSKKISIQGPAPHREYHESDESVFGGPSLLTTSKKPLRAKSLTRPPPGRPFFSPPLPASSSHPGWTGDGFDTAGEAAPTPALYDEVSSSSSQIRIRHGSSTSGLDTLSETGPAVDQFSVPVRDVAFDRLGNLIEEVMTPPRRRASEGAFNLFGSKVAPARRLSTMDGGKGPGGSLSAGQRRSLPDIDMAMEEDGDSSEDSIDSPQKRPSLLGLSTRPRRLSNLQFNDVPHSTPPPTTSNVPLPSRRAASLDSLFLSSVQQGSPFNRAGTITTPHGSREAVNPSVHNLRDHPNLFGGGGRKRNANGALLVGKGATSNLAAASPIVARSSSPAPWNARDTRGEMDEEEEEEEDAMEEDSREMIWDGSTSPPPPSLTDGTTSASSSLSTSLSSHAEGDHVNVARSNSQDFLSRSTSGIAPNGTFFTPQNYKHVRPLQAAFMSAGLVSKRSRARNDSGIGLGLAPAYRPVQPFPDIPLHSSLDGTTQTGEPGSTIPAVNVLRLSTNSVMPDTPVKRATSFSHGRNSLDKSHSLPTLPTPEDDSSVSPPTASASHTGDSISPDGSNASASTQKAGATSSSASPCRGRSSSQDIGDVSPTTNAARSGPKSLVGGPAWKRTNLYRRRSSGQLSCETNLLGMKGGLLGANGSSGSSGSGGHGLEMEPMTPTKSVGTKWSETSQLVATPTDSPNTPAAQYFPPSYLPVASTSQHHSFPPPLATPHLRQSYPLSHTESMQHAQGPRPLGVGRSQFKERHSSSSLQSLRQQEDAPSWFETNYTVLSSLGNGAFSDAFEVADKERNGVHAVKRTKHAFGGPKDRLRRFEEVDILRLITSDDVYSPHLIHLVDAWEQNGHLFIQTELCENGNLAFFLEEYGRLHEVLDEARVWKILNEVSAGVHFLHERNVIHLDLKPANVFITDRGHLRIGDFGLATRWPRADALSIVRGAAVQSPGREGSAVWHSPDEGKERRVRTKSTGDVPDDLEREGDRDYIAPEIMGGRYGKEADIFSLGLIVLEAAANVILPDNGPAWHKLRSNDLSDVDLSKLSHELVVLITSLLQHAPEDRSSTTEIVHHPVVERLSTLLEQSIQIENRSNGSGSDGLLERPLLGAILPQADSFLYDLFSSVYSYETSGETSMELD